MKKLTDSYHNKIPGNYYDLSTAKNSFQRFWHQKRYAEVGRTLEKIRAKMVLDIGCHGGRLTSKILEKIPQAKIFGIDISRQAIDYASKKYPLINFRIARAENIPFDNSMFDLITCFEVLEHLEDPSAAIKEINRTLKNGGNFLILVPTENLLFKIIWSLWTKFGPGKIWQHTHIQKFTDKKLDTLLEKYGFRIIHRKTFLLGMLLLIRAQKNTQTKSFFSPT